jgi:tetratricopeptide (TPR) repeat protein
MGAAKRGDVDALAASLSEHPELLHNRSEETAEKLLGNTALHWASALGHLAAARWLLARRADPNGRNLGGSSPLHAAASHARPELIELLLANGADPLAADQHGETAHDAAHRRSFAEIAGLLDRGCALPAIRWLTRARPESSASARALGNAEFGRGALRIALGHYTDALVLREEAGEPTDDGEVAAALYSNRSAAHASLGQASLALEDAEQVLAHRPGWAKGWSRKGSALHLAQDWAEAAAAYTRGLELEPENDAMRKGLDDAEAALGAHGSSG